MGISWLIGWLVIGFIVMYIYFFKIRYPKATIRSLARDLAVSSNTPPTKSVMSMLTIWMVVLLIASVILFPLLIVGYFKWKKRESAEIKSALG